MDASFFFLILFLLNKLRNSQRVERLELGA